MANPRGSAGRGQALRPGEPDDPAGAEFGDIIAGVAHCVADGSADPDRVAAIGASYGGYLTAWAIATGHGLSLRRRHRRHQRPGQLLGHRQQRAVL